MACFFRTHVLAVALLPAITLAQSGTPGTTNSRAEVQRLRLQNDSLRHVVDSLIALLPNRPTVAVPQVMEPSISSLEASTTPSSQGAPFGLSMGTSEKALRAVIALDSVKGQRGVFSTAHLPKSLPEFEEYTLVVSPKEGLCKVSAIGRNISTSVYGSEGKQVFDRIDEMVAEKYGRGKRFDFLRSGSIWNEPRDWMMGLLKKERVLVSFWDPKEGSSLPPTISNIGLELIALSTEKAYVRLSFEFFNFDACSKELKTNPF